MKPDFAGVVSRSPYVCNKYPANRKHPVTTPPIQGPRRTGVSAATAMLAALNRSARNNTVEMSPSASFTRTKVDPHTRHIDASARSARYCGGLDVFTARVL